MIAVDAGDIRQMLAEAREKHDIPGIALAVFSSREILVGEAHGLRRFDNPAEVTLDDKFHLGSNTKAMTATVLASLVEENLLSWDRTVAETFADLGESLAPSLRPITLRHLLSHRAGIQPFTGDSELPDVPKAEGTPREQRDRFARWLLQKTPFVEPGTKNVYSNAGYAIAAVMAERASNRSWEDLMRERLFAPLRLDGGFGWPALENRNQPWGHRYEGDEGRPFAEWQTAGTLRSHPPTDSYQLGAVFGPGGDIHLSILDFARFCQIHLRGCRGQTTILRPDTIRLLHEDHYSQGYAMGWVVAKAPDGTTASWHNGSAGTFYSMAVIAPRDDRGAVLACNAGHKNARQSCEALMQTIVNGFAR
jgi:CubicO group peptidase (beta-lactamase class C family)